jgi:DNA-directed RNA polymerase specialized sigma24 family protein
MRNKFLIANAPHEDPAVFRSRFWRCHGLLRHIATRVLGGPERVKGAVENCWLAASRDTPRFEHESAFRSWLVRVLIDEALAILRQNQESLESATSAERNPTAWDCPEPLTGADLTSAPSK